MSTKVCPKNYGSFDQRTDTCPKCKQGFLYQTCKTCGNSACAGWNSETGSTNCCGCYKDELQLLKDINNLALSEDEGAQKLILEWLCVDLSDYGAKDMITCKMQSYIEGDHNGRRVKSEGKV